MKPCNCCERLVPVDRFPRAGKQGRLAICSPCANDRRRLNSALRPLTPDPVQTHLNNVAALWFGPVTPQPRYAV
ncbi:hypothetical protein D3C81_731710 [compost metagenome]